MNTKRTLITVAAIATLGGGGAAIAGAAGGGDDDATDKPITGAALERARAAALAHVGGGKVTGTEAGDEEGAYEVEVTRSDGTQVDVHLNSTFGVLSGHEDREDSSEDETEGEG